ncbi:crotonase/enoyl-CoA hydratase family protein [Paraburkholderia mimosarum]|uniref:crotonase/enoyl-CoA hydratase family protein n=1 Tax=Paraburkholderia mimosarum TaxID=312026 RepID=UPI000404A6B5|nr:crotonase/enoyl-CoA hydratase family protein [Paraburkholderia mimosarum]
MTNNTSTAAESLIEIQREGEIALVKLNRADKRNAINDALLAELASVFTDGLEGARAVILHGEGEHFCAGLDLFELMSKRSPDVLAGMRRTRAWHRTFDQIQYGELPVISVLKGGVIGGGFELAAATHVRVVERSAFFQLPEGQRGIFLGGSGSVRIPRLIGASRVTEMMLTGSVLNVDDAHRIGLAHYVVDDGAGVEKARELARRIASNAPATNYAIINGISRISEMPVGEGLFAETMITSMTRSANTDAAKRIAEFFDGRRNQTSSEAT